MDMPRLKMDREAIRVWQGTGCVWEWVCGGIVLSRSEVGGGEKEFV
jgi:hypothetical protein